MRSASLSDAIPFLNLPAQHRGLREPILEAIGAILDRGNFVLGDAVARFEREAAEYLGVAEAIGVASGTDALFLALQAAGVGPGDEVITPAYSFFAVAEAIERLGAAAVYVDIDPETCNADPEGVRAALGPRTRAVVPVHLYGLPAPMEEYRSIIGGRDIFLLEDAAQAFGAARGEKRAGDLGDAAAFSFYPTKNLGACGDGGLVTTADGNLAGEIRILRDHGQTGKYLHGRYGWNSRLDAFQAAILSIKLPLLEGWNERRRALAARYRESLAGLPLRLPSEPKGYRHVYHQFTVRTPLRDALRERLAEKGIATATHYPRGIHEQPAVAAGSGFFPEAERAAREALCLPIYPELTDEAADRTAREIRAFFERGGKDAGARSEEGERGK
ncbi:MAG: DegT/DnrJ/EryC1/StrS family aminotransferase [Candidatus Eisenbacteria bacterium]|nr:DegT/DnrJ/EryC1/StrS family aminotransferase [Candidatus Eisenbacteria bacterium]